MKQHSQFCSFKGDDAPCKCPSSPVQAVEKAIHEIAEDMMDKVIASQKSGDWRDRAIKRYEEYADVHSQKTFAALMRALEVAHEAGRLSLKTELVEKVRGIKRSEYAVGDAPGDNAVGSEHRAFGFNAAIDIVLLIIDELK